MTLALLAAGWRVAAVGRTQLLMDELTALARAQGSEDRLLCVTAHVTSAADCAAAVEQTVAHFGAG